MFAITLTTEQVQATRVSAEIARNIDINASTDLTTSILSETNHPAITNDFALSPSMMQSSAARNEASLSTSRLNPNDDIIARATNILTSVENTVLRFTNAISTPINADLITTPELAELNTKYNNDLIAAHNAILRARNNIAAAMLAFMSTEGDDGDEKREEEETARMD